MSFPYGTNIVGSMISQTEMMDLRLWSTDFQSPAESSLVVSNCCFPQAETTDFQEMLKKLEQKVLERRRIVDAAANSRGFLGFKTSV